MAWCVCGLGVGSMCMVCFVGRQGTEEGEGVAVGSILGWYAAGAGSRTVFMNARFTLVDLRQA